MFRMGADNVQRANDKRPTERPAMAERQNMAAINKQVDSASMPSSNRST